ncbi:glycosyltransferase family 2 protein [Nioella aestuarii]|uniref:glycosyltransferase family 2 protein n=1 Tax=Nioella aestuarii TaxID=1662864 RepID=UPI003D7FC9DB
MSSAAFSKDEFDPQWYLSTYGDVRDAGVDPWDHYKTYGYKEGRLGGPVRALELDQLLWRGFEKEATVELRLLLKNGTAREKAVAGWIIARHAASKARWKTALAGILAFFERETLGTAIVSHKGPWLLGIKAAAACGQITVAKDILSRAEARFGFHPDFALSELDLEVAAGSSDTAFNACLKRAYQGSQLVPVELSAGTDARFDRLTASRTASAKDKGPLVSVIVPAFNSESTISTCLRGLIDQSWMNLEIIVVDDASTDRTADVAEDAARADARIRVIRQPQNSGAYAARNAGLSVAQGSFFTVHDADDWSHPQKIEQQVNALLSNSKLIACTSHWVRAGSDLSMTLWRMDQGWIYRNVSSLMMRMEVRETLGYWDRVRVNADTEYYHRLISVYGSDAVHEQMPGVPLSFGRNSPQSLTMSSATHLSTQFRGPRRSYLDAALHWHQTCLSKIDHPDDKSARAAALHMPQFPEQRSFPAPDALGPLETTTKSSDYNSINNSSRFDGLWYLTRNRDVLAADVDPIQHYLKAGGSENRDPGPLFSDSAWRKLKSLNAEAVPLLDWERADTDPEDLPFRFDGALSDTGRPVALVFAHAAERQILGAERTGSAEQRH